MTPDDPESGAPRPGGPLRGDPVIVRYTKWDGSPHWTFPATFLGEDEFGRWVGCPPDTVLERPGVTSIARRHFVGVMGQANRWTPFVYEATSGHQHDQAPGVPGVAIYTDITSHPAWSRDGHGWEVTMVDLDLDVIKLRDGSIHVDDEDEFAEHQVAMNYPADVIARARVDCAHVFMAMEASDEPYGSVGQVWLEGFIAGSLNRHSG